MGCATAQDDQLADWGDPPASKDSGTASLDSSPVDSGTTADSSVDDTTVTEDSTVTDSTVADTAVDTTPAVDTAPPPFDTGPPTGACMWCATGNCSTAFEDYACLLDCLSGGFFDCHFDKTASKPCTCVP